MSSADPMDHPSIVALAEGLHVRQAVDNIGWIDLGDGLLVVDALEQPELEGEVLAAIRQTAGEKRVRYVLNTHLHYDHVALNAAFQQRFGATIVNARTTHLAPDGLWLEGPARRVQVLPMGGCHTDEDCVAWSPADRALFVGDIFGWGLIPSAGLDRAQAARLEATYCRLIGLDAAAVIPGHGPVCSTAELRRWLEYFRWLCREVSAACASQRNDRKVLAQIPPPQDMKGWWRFVQWKHQDSLGKVLQAVRSGGI